MAFMGCIYVAENQYGDVDVDPLDEDMNFGDCEEDIDCLPGCYCGEGECVETEVCFDDADCEDVDDGLVCDEDRQTCIPEPRPRREDDEPECQADADCEDDLVCEAAECLDPDDLCVFNHECGPGAVCEDSFCRPTCEDDEGCPAGLACVDGICEDAPERECDGARDCSEDRDCRDGACCARCDRDAECGDWEHCDDGLCVWDGSPRPFCLSDDDCAVGHRCHEGVCRSPCETNVDCSRFDVAFGFCGDAGWCLTANEVNPECGRALDCGERQRCLDAICRNR